MKNKKGTTLIELVISLALISVVLVFMVSMLVDINDTFTNSYYAKNNQMIRAEIIRTIENDLRSNKVTKIESVPGSDKYTLTITFSSGPKATITATARALTFEHGSVKRTWEVEDCTIYTKNVNVVERKDRIYYFNVNLEVHTTNDRNKEGNNNILDDIQISYIGEV